jgi:TonB family protein
MKSAATLLLILLPFASAVAADTDFFERPNGEQSTARCLRELTRSSEIQGTSVFLNELSDLTGTSGSLGSVPMDVTFMVRQAVQQADGRIAVHMRSGTIKTKEIPANRRLILIDGGLTQADTNPIDERKQSNVGLSFGGGRMRSNADVRKDDYVGGLCGAVVLQAYDLRAGGTSAPKLTAEVSFCTEQTVSGNDWAITLGPIGAGKSVARRVNRPVHEVVRLAIDLAVAKLVGGMHDLPYWRCGNGIFGTDPDVVATIRHAITGLTPQSYDAFAATVLAQHGYTPGQRPAAYADAHRLYCDSRCAFSERDAFAYLYINRPLVSSDMTTRGTRPPQNESPVERWTMRNGGPTQPERVQRGVRLVRGAEPRYPARAKLRGIAGRVDLELRIDPFGRVSAVRATNRAHELLIDAAVRAARSWTFNSEPSSVSDRIWHRSITFSLEDQS